MVRCHYWRPVAIRENSRIETAMDETTKEPKMNSAIPGRAEFLWLDLRVILRQVGQIHFQRSTLTGATILLALAAVNPWAAAGALFASIVAASTARIARMPRQHFRRGLYGYNAALTGAGYLSFYQSNAQVFALLAAVSMASVLATGWWLHRSRLPALTGQFVIAMWLAFALEPALGLLRLHPPGCANNWASVLCSVGQITFVSGIGPSSALLLVFARHSREEAPWLAFGAMVAWAASEVLRAALPHQPLEGMALTMAVNAALVGQGLTVFGVPVGWRHTGIALSLVLSFLFSIAALPCFTLPFCLVVWALLALHLEPGLDEVDQHPYFGWLRLALRKHQKER
jgi:urea transporter